MFFLFYKYIILHPGELSHSFMSKEKEKLDLRIYEKNGIPLVPLFMQGRQVPPL
jgi:hypothetical protein